MPTDTKETIQPLTEEEIKWMRKKIRNDEAMSDLAKKVRNWFTFIVLLLTSFFLFGDAFKSFVKWAAKSVQ